VIERFHLAIRDFGIPCGDSRFTKWNDAITSSPNGIAGSQVTESKNALMLRAAERGFSFVEMIIVTMILIILASAVLPLARVTAQRQREAELRRSLREVRNAIDKFKDSVDNGLIATTELRPGSEGYPADLDTLVEGVPAANDASGRKLKFLRRVPVDPMTGGIEWGKRSYQDKADSTSWGGQNVFDVFTTSEGTALDGTKYKDW
jgi:general secretion pathway protein G